MSKELTTISEKRFNNIITRAGDPNSLEFKTIDDKALAEINEWMPEVNRATNSFNKQNSQTTLSLMTLNMIDSAPYRVLRQILAQVEKKRGALKENLYNIEKKKLQYLEFESKDDLPPLDDLEMRKIACDIIDSQSHIEQALKELGSLKRRYEEICKNKNIPETWDEQDFENQEIEHHIKSIFRNAIRDKMQGGCNMGTMEYFEQYGISPIVGYACVDNYLAETRKIINDTGQGPDINSLYQFYDNMYNLFKNEYKKAAARIGLDNITQADFLFKDNVG